MVHKPVLLGEAIENLNLKPGSTVFDGTLGAGGHAAEIIKKILPGGKLIAVDWDKRATDEFGERAEARKFISNGELILVNDNYANIDEILGGLGVKTVDAVLVDLGFSSDQIEKAERGFSLSKIGPLDMRYSPENQKQTAADIVNEYPEEKLKRIFQEYGEEKFAGRIARNIVEARKINAIKTTSGLADIVSKAIPKFYRKGKIHPVKSREAGSRQGATFDRIHPATRIFQALRIEVNKEFDNLNKFLEVATDNLASGGRLAIISFHSLEDRIVKNYFKAQSKDCVCPPKFPKCVCGHKQRLNIITRKPIVPTEREIKGNPRSRSAKMRVAEKI